MEKLLELQAALEKVLFAVNELIAEKVDNYNGNLDTEDDED